MGTPLTSTKSLWTRLLRWRQPASASSRAQQHEGLRSQRFRLCLLYLTCTGCSKVKKQTPTLELSGMRTNSDIFRTPHSPRAGGYLASPQFMQPMQQMIMGGQSAPASRRTQNDDPTKLFVGSLPLVRHYMYLQYVPWAPSAPSKQHSESHMA